MNRSRWFTGLVVGLLFAFAVVVFTQTAATAQPSAATGAKPKTAKLASTASKQNLSEDEIAALKTEWINEAKNKKITIQAELVKPKLSDKAIERLKKKGQVPYRLIADVYEWTLELNKWNGKRLKTDVSFYILDSAGKVVSKKTTESSLKLCPT